MDTQQKQAILAAIEAQPLPAMQKEWLLSLVAACLEQDAPAITDSFVNGVREAMETRKATAPVPPLLEHDQHYQELLRDITLLKQFILNLAKGDLSQPLPLKGSLAGALKTLQANLKHLTWQTQMIAKGDFTQRVDFMGEFAEAFNRMVEQLASMQAELLRSQERYRELAITDQLTGLYNRRYFFEYLGKEYVRGERSRKALSIIMFDLDHFKAINDTYGHHVGDMALKQTAVCALSLVRAGDTVCRFGGEEFIILLPDTALHQAAIIAERIRASMESLTICHEGVCFSMTASFGVCSHSWDHTAPQDRQHEAHQLVNKADETLYQAKRAGRNRVHTTDGLFRMVPALADSGREG